MELVQVVEILKQHGWHTKLTCQGYRICVGSFWASYALRKNGAGTANWADISGNDYQSIQTQQDYHHNDRFM